MTQTPYDILCPFHISLSAKGFIRHLGPSMAKLIKSGDAVGKHFFDFYSVERPYGIVKTKQILPLEGKKLLLALNCAEEYRSKAVAAKADEGGIILNCSLGIGLQSAVQYFNLTYNDFGPSDLAIEMLYLLEAKAAIRKASRDLTHRLQGAKIMAEEQAYSDALTGLQNRRALEVVLSRLISSGVSFSLMQLDLDRFKNVNDTLGHAAGDHVLQKAAEVLQTVVRNEDAVIRLGGDEFVIVFANLKDRRRLSILSERIIEELQKPIFFDNQVCHISASIGITTITADRLNNSAENFLKEADHALHQSKANGKSCYSFYEPVEAVLSELKHM